jgi:hypothetical protein
MLYYRAELIPYPRVDVLLDMCGVELLKGYLQKYVEELEKEKGLK